jgi:hypothetical protein
MILVLLRRACPMADSMRASIPLSSTVNLLDGNILIDTSSHS